MKKDVDRPTIWLPEHLSGFAGLRFVGLARTCRGHPVREHLRVDRFAWAIPKRARVSRNKTPVSGWVW